MDNNFKFLYWDDLGDSQRHVDNQKTACSNHNRQLEEDLLEERLKSAEWAEMEEELNKRMDIIGQNGATAEGYLKTCKSCNIEKAFIEFHNNSSSKDGKHSYCKVCSSKKNKEWRDANPEKRKASLKKWKSENKEKIKEYKRNRKPTTNEISARKSWERDNSAHLKEYRRKYKIKNRERLSKREKVKKDTDPVYRSICNIRSRVSSFCRSISIGKNFSTTKSIGLTAYEFKSYIESMFKDGMSWSNYGEWHIDHIIPLSTAKCEGDVVKLNHYTNLQPLWWIDNILKSNKQTNTGEHYEDTNDDIN